MYCTKQDLIDRFGEHELRRYAWDQQADAANDDQINRAITDASELIDLYIGRVVSLPLATTPEIITSLATDIARYRLQDDNPLDITKERYEGAVKRLQDIAQGKAALIVGEPETSVVGTVWTKRDDDDRLFTNETLADF